MLPLSQKNQAKPSGHTLWTSFTDLTLSSPNFLPFVALVVISVYLSKEFFSQELIKKTTADEENLVPFYQAMSEYGKSCITR